MGATRYTARHLRLCLQYEGSASPIVCDIRTAALGAVGANWTIRSPRNPAAWLAQALDLFKRGLGDVAMVLAFTGLRWEEAVAVPIGNVSLDGQRMKIDRTASESGGRRDVRQDLKIRAAERTIMIPDIAMSRPPRPPGRPPGRNSSWLLTPATSSPNEA